jgi:hypothetical protein
MSDIHFNSFATRNRRAVLKAISAEDEESYSVRTIPAILKIISNNDLIINFNFTLIPLTISVPTGVDNLSQKKV